MVEFAVVGDLAFGTETQVMDKDVVVAHESDALPVGGEGCQLLPAFAGEGLDFLVFEIIDVIFGSE